MCTVDIAIEVEQMHFEHGPGAAYCRPNAQICHTWQGLIIKSTYFDSKHAGHGQRIVLDAQVGGGKADLATQLLPVYDLAIDDISAAKQSRRMRHIPLGQRLAHTGTGNTLTLSNHAAQALNREA